MSGLWRPPDIKRRRPGKAAPFQNNRNRGSNNGDRVLTAPAPQAQRRMTLRSFRPLRRNSLIGFACVTMPVGPFDLQLDDIALHEQGGHFWAGLPARPMVGADGTITRKSG